MVGPAMEENLVDARVVLQVSVKQKECFVFDVTLAILIYVCLAHNFLKIKFLNCSSSNNNNKYSFK